MAICWSWAGPDLLGMGGLTADEDFGKGRGLAVGILHQHSVGAGVLNHTSEKEQGRSLVGVHTPLQMGKAGWEGSLVVKTLGWSLGPPEKLRPHHQSKATQGKGFENIVFHTAFNTDWRKSERQSDSPRINESVCASFQALPPALLTSSCHKPGSGPPPFTQGNKLAEA